MDTTKIEIEQADRRILLLALNALDRQLADGGAPSVDRESILRLRAMFAPERVEIVHPDHIEVDVSALSVLMATLPSTESWRIFLNDDTVEGRFTLAAELTDGQAVWDFELARGLRGGNGYLALAEDDQKFVSALEETIRATGHSSQIIHEVIEIPLPWDFMPDDGVDTRIEEFLASHAESHEYVPAIHSTYVDIHSDEELADLGYASVAAEISGYEEEMEEARAFIARVIESVKATPAPVL